MSGLPRFSITDITFDIGEDKLDVAELNSEFNKAISKTGITHVFSTKRNSYDLSLTALKLLVNRNPKIQNGSVALVHISQSNSDYLPAFACRLQHDAGLMEDTFAFDVGQGCSGFVQGLFLASRLLIDYEKIVLVCCDTYRSKLDINDRSTSTLFSDAATATLIERGGLLSIKGSSHMSDGSGAQFLYHSKEHSKNGGQLYMAGGDVLVFTKRVIFRQAEEMLKKVDLGVEDVQNIYVHQASKLVLDELERRFGSQANMPRNISEFGNTVSSSIPLLIRDRLDEVNSSLSLMCGFGVGLSSSCLVLSSS